MEKKDFEYTNILKALMELPFQVGKNLLVDFLVGDYSNKSITKNRLDELNNFGSLPWDRERVFAEIDRLISNGMIELVQSDYNRFVKILSLTIRGRNEITHPTLEEKSMRNKINFSKNEINDEDKRKFVEFEKFLKRFNDEQKKAIVSDSRNLLCVAGAGSGKTTVLTKRIEFLVKYKKVSPEKILAVTFTRKAREEMRKRLDRVGISGVKVHTFNSFCERTLQRYGAQIYGRPVRVLGYGDKVLAMNMAAATLGLDMEQIVDEYFNVGQKKFKTTTQLINSFMNDCFAVMDYFKVSGSKNYDWSGNVDGNNKINVERISRITKYLKQHMETQGLRDYTDQVIDSIEFFKNNPESVPKFEHVLVDEYQDVNAMQIELIRLLNPKNLFVVGDPRQSIFGWRGSDVNYILNFEKDFGDAETCYLKKNYRSLGEIVNFMNLAIRSMGLPDLENHFEGDAKIKILDFNNEDAEREFVLNEIENSDVELKDIFVLARTNKILMELSKVMNLKGIPNVVRADESNGRKNIDNADGVILSTVHAIKGLQAKKVFVVGVNEQNFPCKVSDHPAVEMVKSDDYDREEEERRLFYVAVSRAREELVVTYSKKASHYISDEMRALTGGRVVDNGLQEESVDEELVGELKSWRNIVSEELGVPLYVVLSNKTIEGIAEKKPKSAEDLMKISGIGPEKLMKYGERILKIVEDFEG